jgi:hypothetical protein
MRVSTYLSLQDVPEEVRRRLSYPIQSDFFLSFDWFSLLFATSLGRTMTPRIYVISDEQDAPLGALFCAVETRGSRRCLLSLTNYYTMEYSASVVRGEPQTDAVVAGLIAHIAAERPRWHSIRLTFLKTDTPEARGIVDQLRQARFDVYPFFQYENWYYSTGGETFQTYFSKRRSQVRNTITRKQKELAKNHNFEIKLVGRDATELEPAVRDFITVYNSSWKRPEPFPDFIPTLASTCAGLGILRLGVLYVAGKPAAGQLWITAGRRTIIYKLAYDEQYRELGVGSVLSKEMFRAAIDDDHVDEIDYGVGSEPYKKDWMASVRNIGGVEAFNRGSLRGAFLSTMMAARTTIRKGRTLFQRG